MPLSQEILYTQLFGATTWTVPRFVLLSVFQQFCPRMVIDASRSQQPRAPGAGRYDLNCESVFAAGEFARCQCSASEKVGTAKSRTSADPKKKRVEWKTSCTMHTWIYLWFLSFCINIIWFIWIVGNPCQSTTTSRPLRLSSPKTPTFRAYRVEGMGHKEDGTRGWQLWMDPVNFFLGWDCCF